jgi:N-formylglutamate amidohydrolase
MIVFDPDGAGFATANCESPALPLLLSIPHAGRDYPADIFDNLRIRADDLVRLEDRYADRLAAPAIAAGIPAICAHRARAWIDLNRAEDDLDPAMVLGNASPYRQNPSAKMRGGLGLVPRRLAHAGEIWKRPIASEAIEARLDSFHRPYHRTISGILGAMRARFGIAILVDLHSMPPLSNSGQGPPKIVIGDRFGQSAASIHTEMLIGRLRERGVHAGLNHPYPGDHMLRQHGDLRRNIHAIQIEVDRSLYLDSELREPTSGLAPTAALISELLFLLADNAMGLDMPMAAE